jgi:hypothetical protein
MKFTVYHLSRDMFRWLPDFDEVKLKAFIIKNFTVDREYSQVAIVEVDDINDIFRVTNNITEDWSNNPEVLETFSEDGDRSTSVGDVYYSHADEVYYFVAPYGLTKLGKLL